MLGRTGVNSIHNTGCSILDSRLQSIQGYNPLGSYLGAERVHNTVVLQTICDS